MPSASRPPRHVFVSGASRGIGRAVAEAFWAAGDNVATFDRSGLGLGREHPRLLALTGSVLETAAVNAAFDQAEAAFGRLEVLVANAGVVRDRPLLRMSDADFAAPLETNLGGAFRQVRRAARSMAAARRGAIVLIGSLVGSIGGAGQANYAASKAALTGLARSVARELGGRGITANVIAPGFIATDMTAGLPPATQQAYLARIPAGRFGAPDEIARAALFLAEAGYVNGAVIPVDGGLGMGG
ncbi:MAG: SDR family oxidoreductase [Bifidobacteriaceae bacterium]|nr:SDR family oxidoreductase [Bifidobacteriaceae bacterium]